MFVVVPSGEGDNGKVYRFAIVASNNVFIAVVSIGLYLGSCHR